MSLVSSSCTLVRSPPRFEHVQAQAGGGLNFAFGGMGLFRFGGIDDDYAVLTHDGEAFAANDDGRGLADAHAEVAGMVKHNTEEAVHATAHDEMLVDDEPRRKTEAGGGGRVARAQSGLFGHGGNHYCRHYRRARTGTGDG